MSNDIQRQHDKEAYVKVVTEELKRQHDETRSLLDELRRIRASRGGSGAPLEQPKHLRQAIIVTDAELADGLRTE